MMEKVSFDLLPEMIKAINDRLNRIEALVNEPSGQSNSTPDPSSTVKELSDCLYNAISTVYGLVTHREIPHLKKGKRLYILKYDIDLWLSQGWRKTVKEISESVNNKWRDAR